MQAVIELPTISYTNDVFTHLFEALQELKPLDTQLFPIDFEFLEKLDGRIIVKNNMFEKRTLRLDLVTIAFKNGSSRSDVEEFIREELTRRTMHINNSQRRRASYREGCRLIFGLLRMCESDRITVLTVRPRLNSAAVANFASGVFKDLN